MHQSLWWRGFESHSFHFIDIPRQSIVSLIWKPAQGIVYHPPSHWAPNMQAGWPRDMRRWFMGFSHYDGVGSSPTPVILPTFLYKVFYPLYWLPANAIFYNNPCYWPQIIQARSPCGLRCQFKAQVTSVAWLWVPLLTFCRHLYTKYCFPSFEHLHMVSSTIIDGIDLKTYRHDGWVQWGAGFTHHSLQWRGFKS